VLKNVIRGTTGGGGGGGGGGVWGGRGWAFHLFGEIKKKNTGRQKNPAVRAKDIKKQKVVLIKMVVFLKRGGSFKIQTVPVGSIIHRNFQMLQLSAVYDAYHNYQKLTPRNEDNKPPPKEETNTK